MQQTEHYKLNLIETSDTFSPDALNENAKTLDDLLRGRLVFAYGEYVGDGTRGEDSPKRLEFTFKPLMVVVVTRSNMQFGQQVWLRGIRQACSGRSSSSTTTYEVTVTWEDRAVQWYANNSQIQLNNEGNYYYYLALGIEE